MRSSYKMRMLLAVAYDARGRMYIAAVALVCGEESVDNVTWFLNHVKCGGITTASVIVSDRGAALLASVPAVYAGMCMYMTVTKRKNPLLEIGSGADAGRRGRHS
jgi:hypothetical protein